MKEIIKDNLVKKAYKASKASKVKKVNKDKVYMSVHSKTPLLKD